MECIFCKIARGEIPSTTVYEDSDIRAFDDIHPKAPVHILIIPKEHIESIIHLEADRSTIIAKLIYTAKHIALEKGMNGYKLVFNVGRAGGQVVNHLHLHLLGGWQNDKERTRDFPSDQIVAPE